MRGLTQEVQWVWFEPQVRQGGVQGRQILLTATVPAEQLVTQRLFWRLLVLQLVQLVVVREQVRQSPAQATAMPEMLT